METGSSKAKDDEEMTGSHAYEHLLVGWFAIRGRNGEGKTGRPEDNDKTMRKKTTKKALRDVDDVS